MSESVRAELANWVTLAPVISVIVTALSAAGTITVAGFLAWVASQQRKIAEMQARTARDKLKLDLFDRRYRVYRGLQRFLRAISKEGAFSRDDLNQFYISTSAKSFLFGEDVCTYLTEIREKAISLREAGRLSNAGHPDQAPLEVQTKAVGSEYELLNWFELQYAESAERFRGYIGFDHVRES